MFLSFSLKPCCQIHNIDFLLSNTYEDVKRKERANHRGGAIIPLPWVLADNAFKTNQYKAEKTTYFYPKKIHPRNMWIT